MDNLSKPSTETNGTMAESEVSNFTKVEESGKNAVLHKPFKTIDEQIEILNARGLQTDNDTRYTLEREGYYPVINGYKDFFLDNEATVKNGNDVYLSGVTFNDVYRLFSFDRDLRTTFMRYFAMAEAALKTVCAYKFTEAHAGEKNPYMNIANYRAKYQKKGKAPDLIGEFGKAIGHDRESDQWRKKTYLRHYVEDHDGEVPLWVLMNFATLGQAFRFYCFMEEGMQNEVAKVFSGLYEDSYGIPKRIYPKMLRMAFDHIKDFRNICAHDERLYCAKVTPSSDTPIAKAIDDLELVIPKEQHERLKEEVRALVGSLVSDIAYFDDGFVKSMGFDPAEFTSSQCSMLQSG